MSLIELRHVSKRFGPLVVLDKIDLNIEAGKCLAVIGPSGTGKSVLLKHIVGLLKPDSGEVWFDGQRIDTMTERHLAEIRVRFGFLFQMGALFDSMTVEENVAFPLIELTRKPPEEITKIVLQKLTMVGLPDAGPKMAGELSGGQRKRVALARAIAQDPHVILYDEPTTGLDPIRSDVINELIIKLQQEMKVTSIVVTHDMHSVFRVADRIVMLNQGHLIFDGTSEQIRHSQDEMVRHFVEGKATQQEMGTLQIHTSPAAESVVK
jgi:phospholipid/cholesterol/gamma-HCH transport system ATP-binding protein